VSVSAPRNGDARRQVPEKLNVKHLISLGAVLLDSVMNGMAWTGLAMGNQPWKTSVEIDELENALYVRVIEDGIVNIKAFKSLAEAKSFAKSERARLALEAPVR
jgi:hypothetical protein